jgi:hypothetical protein
MTKKLKIEFAPGAFDNFDGTQEELNELVAEITRMAESGELEKNSRRIDMEDPSDEDIEAISHILASEISSAQKKLQ